MGWITPKTDWFGETDANGNYRGDYFNAADMERIWNNTAYLEQIAIEIYPSEIWYLQGNTSDRQYFVPSRYLNSYEGTFSIGDVLNVNWVLSIVVQMRCMLLMTQSDLGYDAEYSRYISSGRYFNPYTVSHPYLPGIFYSANNPTMTYEELNVIESAMIGVKSALENKKYQRHYVWNFGIRGGL